MIEGGPLRSVQGRSTASRLICALLFLVTFGAAPLLAQSTPPTVQVAPALQARSAEFSASIVDLARRLEGNPRMRGLSPQERQERVEFVVGNVHFVAAHELGHALVSELNLPVLGREEDTADVYAILKALGGASEFSERILERATNAWFLSARRDRRAGENPSYYERHGLDEQRAYQIVCLMVGSDPVKFKGLAVSTSCRRIAGGAVVGTMILRCGHGGPCWRRIYAPPISRNSDRGDLWRGRRTARSYRPLVPRNPFSRTHG